MPNNDTLVTALCDLWLWCFAFDWK